MKERQWLVRVASTAREVATDILEADLTQLLMILTTVVAAVTYGWIEGYVIQENLADRPYVWFGHFSNYSVALGILFACITGGFALVKSRSMFARGNRYFLFAVIGNYPFAWLIEDFAYFMFNPLDALNKLHWTNWFLGGFCVYDPWKRPGDICVWIPNWYFLVLAWFLVCQFYAHRCTVNDNLVKDELGKQLIQRAVEIPPVEARIELKPGEAESEEAAASGPSVKAPIEKPVSEQPTKSNIRSEDAEAALKRLREKWVK
jgi:hypothetical protein